MVATEMDRRAVRDMYCDVLTENRDDWEYEDCIELRRARRTLL